MFMRFKNFLFLACLLFSGISYANGPLESKPELLQATPPPCNSPAPTNFHIQEVGTNWVRYTWTPVASLAPHRIRTYRASDNLLLNTTIAPAGDLGLVVQGLPSGTEVYGVINAVCPSGNSIYENTTPLKTTLILDILVENNQLPNGDNDCKLLTPGACDFPGNIGQTTPFRVLIENTPTTFRKFGISKSGAAHYEVTLDEDNTNQDFTFVWGTNQNPNGYNQTQLKIKYQGTDIATFTSYENSQDISYLSFTALTAGYSIEQIIPEGEGEGDGKGRPGAPPTPPTVRGRDGQLVLTSADLSAQPNPFSETLDVFVPAQAENIQLQLFNLSGQKVLDQQFTGGQGQYTLSTSDLSSGFYLLRIEVDGQVQTLKVIKS
jgi:hypothetical protein